MKRWLMGAAILGLTACGGGTGDILFTTYGEDFIEKEIPAAEFEDGWGVKFSKFVVALGELTVANHQSEVAAQSTGVKVYDVHRTGPVAVARFTGLEAADWDEVSFAIAPAADATAGNAAEEDVTRMKANGFSVYIAGTATKGGETKRFAWGFPLNTLYEHCAHPDIGPGVTVPSGGEEVVQLTLHGDHLFLDDLQSSEAKMRFQALAEADGFGFAGPDGEVTLDELGMVDLSTLPAGTYRTGGAANVRNLRDFVSALVRTVGHFRGEGECSPRAR